MILFVNINSIPVESVLDGTKVILDRLDKDTDSTAFSKEELDKMKIANELRHIIGQIPHLATFVDEVHHAADNEIKLRQVVSQWAKGNNFNCMLGFSGTPYLEKAEKVSMTYTTNNTNTDTNTNRYPHTSTIKAFNRPYSKW